jgi:ankyrin repeat protein
MIERNIGRDYVEDAVRADPALVNTASRYGRTLLHEAAAGGNLTIIELLLRLGAQPNLKTAGGHTPLYCLANECKTAAGADIVRALVAAGAAVDERSDSKRSTPLHMAARRGNREVAEALIDCGADINAQDSAGDTPLQRARNCRNAALAALLLSRGAKGIPSPATTSRHTSSRAAKARR